ncbi:MAG: response regulator [Ramlibacter sp.]|nr:response regulator [Ramlibacter sp.]
MDNIPPKAAQPQEGLARLRRPMTDTSDDALLGSSIFGPSQPPPAVFAPRAAAKPGPSLKLVVKGLKPIERQLLEGLVRVSQRRTPRLEILPGNLATDADVIVVDTRDADAMAWARRHAWIENRAVIWIDGSEARAGHTLLRRPVQWPILPMVLARALESGPGTLAAAPPPLPEAARSPASHSARAPQILVVDDSLAVRAHLRSLLEPRGFTVTDADCVEAALAAVAQRAFDCVLMDVLMPEVDGYEGCRQIKSRLRGANAVPVVMLTSKGSPFDRIRGKMAGCDAYLTKPVDAPHLAEVLAQQLRAMPRPREAAGGPRAAEPAMALATPRFAATRPA